jgi:hypothetical protein
MWLKRRTHADADRSVPRRAATNTASLTPATRGGAGLHQSHEGRETDSPLERDGHAIDGLLDHIINVLGLDHDLVHALVAEDRRLFEEAWQHWAGEPVEPELRRRLMAASWGRAQMPKGLSREEAVAFAKTRAVKSRLTYMLVWSRKEEIWCYPDGSSGVVTMKVGEAAGPFTRLRGRGNRGFIFG